MNGDYNTLVCPKLIEYIKYFTERIEASMEDTTIQVKKFHAIDSNNFDVNYLIVRGMTGSFTIKVYFTVTVKGETSEFSEDLEVPKMINNIFVIDGTLRVPTNTLDNDNSITVYDANVRLNDFVNVTFEEDPHQPDGYKFTLYIYEDEEPMILDGTRENFDKYKKYLNLTDLERDKLKVKLDTDDVDHLFTYDLLLKLVELGSDKMHDNIIDKKIYSAESNLMLYLWSRDIRKKILTGMKSKFYQFNHIYLKDIQNAINRYFLTASEKNIDFPSTINPLIFDAMKYKIIIPKNVAYNSTMTDIIDVANTPINQNVNRVNELNVCAFIKDDILYIRCYKYPSQEVVEIPYIHYCTKKVLINQYWDYNMKGFKNVNDPIKYKLRLKVYKGTTKDSFDYIEPMPDDKLSLTTRRIPLGNLSDSVRVAMGVTMAKQALELKDSEVPLVDTGHDDADLVNSTLNTKFEGNPSIVEKISDNKIFVKDTVTGSSMFYEIPSPTPAADDSIISYDPTVKVGDKIRSGDIIIRSHMFKRSSFELGTNVRVAYMNYLGYTHEDGGVISESLANRMTHYSIIDVYKLIYPDDIIHYIRPIGSKITSKDILINNQTRLRVSKALKDVYTSDSGLLSGMGISYNQSNLVVPNNMDEGYVIDCRIEILPGRELTNDASKEVIFKFQKQDKSTDYADIPQKFKELHANEVEVDDKVAGYISYKLIRVDKAKVGDKVTNRYGGKGIISLVLPDECMPQIHHADGTVEPVEEILNPAGVLHRKNISQVYECALTKCIYAIYKRCNELIEKDDIKSAKNFLDHFKVIYGDKFDKMSDDGLKKYHIENGVTAYKMSVGFYSKISYPQVLDWMKYLGIKETEKIFCPDVVIVETKDGLKGFSPDKYVRQPNENPKTYELGWCENECITGTEYIMKLWKNAAYDGKVTSEVLETEEPIMGRGMYRWTGQQIGEMELWVLIGAGIEKFVQEQSESMKTSQYQFLNELLLSGYFIQDAAGSPVLSPERVKSRALDKLGK